MFKTINVHESKPLTSNQVSTLQIPVYGKIQGLMLLFTGNAGALSTVAQLSAQIGQIRLSINGRDIVNATAAQILQGYTALGDNVTVSAGVDGAIELNFGRLLFTDPKVRDLFGFGGRDVSSIQVQVSALTLTAAQVANVQGFTAREAVAENFGSYISFIQYPQTYNAIGEHTVDTLPRDTDTAYLACMVTPGAGVIANSEVRINSAIARERVPAAVNALFNSSNRYSQATGFFNHMFTDGALDAVIPMRGVTDFRIITGFSTAPGGNGYVILPLRWHNFVQKG